MTENTASGERENHCAMTLGKTTLSIMTFSIMTLRVKGLYARLSITTLPLC